MALDQRHAQEEGRRLEENACTSLKSRDDEASPWRSRVEDFVRDAKNDPGPFARAFRRVGDWLDDVDPEQPWRSSEEAAQGIKHEAD